MTRLRYGGPFDRVDVLGSDRMYQVRRGETEEFPEDVARNLLRSPDWSLEEPAADDSPATDLDLITGLSTSQREELEAIGLGTLSALASATDDEITAAAGVGPGALNVIRAALGQVPEE